MNLSSLYTINHPPFFLNYLDNVYLNLNTNDKVLFLTFDDGPTEELTSKILSLLDYYEAKATFFCVGENVKKHPKSYKAILDGGHVIGNHTYNHLNGRKSSNTDYYNNIKKCADTLESELFRPPYGKMRISQFNRIRKYYKVILWDVLTRDFDKNYSGEECFSRVKKYAKSGSIITFHDNIKATENVLYALEKTLIYFESKGYKFEALEEKYFPKNK